MKYSVTFEIILRPGAPTLLDVAVGLQEVRVCPESLVWSTVQDSNEARVWMIIDVEAAVMEALAHHFRPHTEIRKIIIADNWLPAVPAEPVLAPVK